MRRATRAAVLATAALFLVCGCRTSPRGQPRSVAVADGVRFVDDPARAVQYLDVDLSAPVLPAIVAQNVARIGGNHVGDAHTVAEWVRRTGALAGVNGGFFGDTYDAEGRRRQIVQMAVVDGQVVAPGGAVRSRRQPGERYLRSAIGFTAGGSPRIAWSAGTARTGPRRANRAVNPTQVRAWDVASAVACGPRLIHLGRIAVADRDERLLSPQRVARTVVAYDVRGGAPAHLLLLRADAMDYADAARFVLEYFPRVHGTQASEAMCLDGGASSQLAYASGGEVRDAVPTGVFVPTALVILEKKKGAAGRQLPE